MQLNFFTSLVWFGEMSQTLHPNAGIKMWSSWCISLCLPAPIITWCSMLNVLTLYPEHPSNYCFSWVPTTHDFSSSGAHHLHINCCNSFLNWSLIPDSVAFSTYVTENILSYISRNVALASNSFSGSTCPQSPLELLIISLPLYYVILVSVLRVSPHAWIPDKEDFPDLSSNMQGPIAPAIAFSVAVKEKPLCSWHAGTVEVAGEWVAEKCIEHLRDKARRSGCSSYEVATS